MDGEQVMTRSEPGQCNRGDRHMPRRPEAPGNHIPSIRPQGSADLPEAPPRRPAWHDISTAEKVGMIAASVLLPPVGVIWGIVYSLALETARRRWGRYALAISSISLLLAFLGTLLVLAQTQ
jgi:hypothetical protein